MTSDDHDRHPDDAEIEEYCLEVMAAEAIPAFEQHLLICHDCQNRVAEMDAQIQGMQAAAREIRVRQLRQRGTGTGV